MSALTLPEPQDINDIIFDYVDMFAPNLQDESDRTDVVRNCKRAFLLLHCASEIAGAGGELESQIFRAFVLDVAYRFDHSSPL